MGAESTFGPGSEGRVRENPTFYALCGRLRNAM